jgi:hypothetical protein
MKDKNTILNEMVEHAAGIMENKMDELTILVSIYREKGDEVRASHWEEEVRKIDECVVFMRERGGCWA